MPLYLISNVVFDSEEMCAMDGDNSGKRMMHCISNSERVHGITNHVEMNAISAHNSRLSTPREFGVSYVSFKSVFTIACQ